MPKVLDWFLGVIKKSRLPLESSEAERVNNLSRKLGIPLFGTYKSNFLVQTGPNLHRTHIGLISGGKEDKLKFQYNV